MGRAHRPTQADRTFSNLVFCRRDRNGRAIWLSESGIPVFDNRGVFAGYCGTTRNITDRVVARDRSCSGTKPCSGRLFEHVPANVGESRWMTAGCRSMPPSPNWPASRPKPCGTASTP